ncbi:MULTISPECIES: fimbrillin family protein [Bacteroidales]|uniref:Fimbrillin family protein n=1 Tax=Bacteroides eggerthii TaxID=28111 RepID=A0ABT7U4Y0_9BACE|nr:MULTISPECIES: fimbrillin family protein [Bacteroidales]MCF2550435.1 fimbrillin family protein [Bacteroides caecigallinarum]MCR8912564.1 fimbrillin family protein [Barnesiella sp. ET7]MDM8145588.1 fimbrillin family protein [Bacteroides eggerthii]
MKIAKYIPAAALALVLAGCQSEDDFISSDYANDPMAVHIRAGIEALQTRVNTAGTGDAWETGDLISVANTSTGAVTGKDKAVYKYNGGTWEPSGADYMVWADDVNTFEAYYPVVEGKTDSYTQFELPADQSSSNPTETNYIGRADYMTAAASQSKSDALNLTFKHHLTKVTVKISGYGDQYATQKPVFQAPTFTVPTTTTTVDGKTLTVAGNGTTVTGLFSEDTSAEAKHSFTAVLLPGKYAADDTFVQLNIQGGTPLIVKANEQLTTGLESGKAYTFNVTVGKDGATINSVTVGDWGTDGWTESGTADEETGPKVNADTHTISLSDVGQLNTELIGQALNGETTNVPLTIQGPMNENDIAALNKYLKDNSDATLSLDLKGATLASIPDLAFSQIKGLVSIELPEGLTKIGNSNSWNGSVFYGCTGLESVKFPSTLEEMAFSSFFDCTNLETIDLSKTKVASIEAALFRNCSSLTSVSFGPKTSVFNNKVFVGCSSLTTIDLSLCEAVPTFNYTQGSDAESPFYGLEKSKITIYVKDADMKTAFEDSEWVSRVGFTADNFVVKNNQ